MSVPKPANVGMLATDVMAAARADEAILRVVRNDLNLYSILGLGNSDDGLILTRTRAAFSAGIAPDDAERICLSVNAAPIIAQALLDAQARIAELEAALAQADARVTALEALIGRVKDAVTFEDEEAAKASSYGLPPNVFWDVHAVTEGLPMPSTASPEAPAGKGQAKL